MKHYIYSSEPGFEFEQEVNSFEFSDIESIVEELLDNEINDCIFTVNPLAKKRQGFFPDPWIIQTELFSQARACLERRFGGKIFAKVIDDNGVALSNKSIDIFSEIIEDRASREQGIVDSGQMFIEMLRNFLKEGIWQYGLQRDDGTILKDISQWPRHAAGGADLIWEDSNGVLQPIIWFGLEFENPIECWTLDKSPKRFELLEVYENPYACNTQSVERWHLFWFSTFWHLDWNALFDNNGNTHIVWMFAECGMEEPVEEFNIVRESCPIDLAEDDTVRSIVRKIDQLFLYKQRALR